MNSQHIKFRIAVPAYWTVTASAGALRDICSTPSRFGRFRSELSIFCCATLYSASAGQGRNQSIVQQLTRDGNLGKHGERASDQYKVPEAVVKLVV